MILFDETTNMDDDLKPLATQLFEHINRAVELEERVLENMCEILEIDDNEDEDGIMDIVLNYDDASCEVRFLPEGTELTQYQRAQLSNLGFAKCLIYFDEENYRVYEF